MTVKEVFLNGKMLYVTGDGYDINGDYFWNKENVGNTFPNLEKMLLYGMLCNNASLIVKKGKYAVDGDPTDGALLVAARKLGLQRKLHDNYRIIKEFPFDSERKRMSVVIEDENNMRFLITKGAPEVLLPRSAYMMKEDGRTLLNSGDESHIHDTIDNMADKALRTLAIGMKPLKKNDSLESAVLEKDLTFIGLYGMMDPPRKDVKKAIAECRAAGIKSVMITGDHEKLLEPLQLNWIYFQKTVWCSMAIS